MKSFVYIDGKADATLSPAIQAMLARGSAYMDECQRRKVNFLPKQVMRPIWAGKGLTDGPLFKLCTTKLLLNV